MQLKDLAKRLGIEEYPESLEEIYKSLDENDYSLCDTDNIKQLEKKYNLIGKYTDIAILAAEKLREDKDMLSWGRLAVAYNKTITSLWEHQIPMPKQNGGLVSDMLPLLVRLAEAETMVKRYKERGFSQEEILRRIKTFGGSVSVCETLYARPLLDTVQYNWMSHSIHAMIFDHKAFNFQPATWDMNAIALKNKENGSTLIMMLTGRFHRSGLVLGSAGCEDEAGSFSADYVETPEIFVGHVVSNGFVQKKTTVLEKSKWECIIRQGDCILNVHIPRKTDLTPAYVAESLREGLEIAQKRYPDLSPKYLCCFSWLMDSRLIEILGEASKITSFTKRFLKYPLRSHGRECIDYVFPGCKNTEVENYPENTSLQRSIKQLMLDGKYIYGTAGIITEDIII